MSDRRNISPETAFAALLGSTCSNLRQIESRDTWPSAVRSASARVNAVSPHPFQLGIPAPLVSYEVLSTVVPAGRWVLTMSSGQLVRGSAIGSDGNFFAYSRFMVGGVEKSLQRTGFFIINQVYETIDTHRFAVTDTFTEDTEVAIEVGFTYDEVTTFPAWNLYSFTIAAFPG